LIFGRDGGKGEKPDFAILIIPSPLFGGAVFDAQCASNGNKKLGWGE
jgi:hypothetical protein